MISAKCPTCGKALSPAIDPAALPFCSPRCKQIDLGRWLKEGYAIPGRPLEEDERNEASASERDLNEE